MPHVNGQRLQDIRWTKELERVGYSPRRAYSEGERGTFVPNLNHPGYHPDKISYIIGPTFSGNTQITDYKDGIAHKLAKAKEKIEDVGRDIADTVFAPLHDEDSSLNRVMDRLDTMAQTIDSTLYPTEHMIQQNCTIL